MSASAFIDTNVFLYLVSGIEWKAERTQDLIRTGPAISVQVLNEFAAVARRKFRLEWPEVRRAMSPIRHGCRLFPLTAETHELGLEIAEQCGLRVYDACIVAAANLAGCDVLMSEDLNAGQKIGRVVIRNPFA